MIPDDAEAPRRWPELWKVLTIREGLAAGDRQGTTLSISCEGCTFDATLYIRGFGKSLSVASATLAGLWDALEAVLSDWDANLRPIRGWKARKDASKP